MRRYLTSFLVMAALLVAASPAVSITIRDFAVSDNGARTSFAATLESPATAANCTALARVVMVSYDRGDPRIIKALGRHRINVCQSGRRGVTYGSLEGYFSTTTLRRPFRYAVCISAEQTLRSGRTSRHYACKPVWLLY